MVYKKIHPGFGEVNLLHYEQKMTAKLGQSVLRITGEHTPSNGSLHPAK